MVYLIKCKYMNKVKIIANIAKVYSPNGLEDFQHEEIDGVIFRHTDVGILFNQQRLNKLNPMAIQKFVDNIRAAKPDIKAPDNVLRKVVKSRYIQSMADLNNYSRIIEREMDELIKDAEQRAAAEEAAKETTSVEPSNTPANE